MSKYKPLPDGFSKICDLRSNSMLNTSSEHLRWIKNSVLSGNYLVLDDDLHRKNEGGPTGYILWANISRESLARLLRIGMSPQYPYEWNEGGITLILDVFTTQGMTRINRKQFLWFLQQKRAIAFIRKGKLKFYLRSKGFYRKADIPKQKIMGHVT